MFRRLQFFWWGRPPWSRRFNWRCWAQWGSMTICTDKDWNVLGKGWLIGPIQITIWPRSDWRDLCYTPSEAMAAEQECRKEMDRVFSQLSE